jgi:hypothetical protein
MTTPTAEAAPVKPILRIQVSLFIYGGVTPETHECAKRDTLTWARDPDMSYEVCLTSAWNDALIDRCRATVCEQFLAHPAHHDVLVMIDHDQSWGPDDVLRIARKAHELQAIVGAAVSKRTRGAGIASAAGGVGIWLPGSDRLEPFDYVGSAFTAWPRSVLEAIFNRAPSTTQGFRPAFLPCTWPHLAGKESIVHRVDLGACKDVPALVAAVQAAPSNAIISVHDGNLFFSNTPLPVDYLSEDWAACRRAVESGSKVYLDLKPQVGHHGAYCYTIADAFHGQDPDAHLQPPDFTLLHATRGRSEQALAMRRLWLERASGLHPIQYIFSCDEDDPDPIKHAGLPVGTKLIVGANRGNVDAYNRAAYASNGDILVQVHDDLVPPWNWDREIKQRIGDWSEPAVLHVSDGVDTSVNAGKPGLLTVLIGTRAWFERCGYFWHPSFASIGCDDHMTALAAKEGVVVEATDLVFQHHWEGMERDETQRHSYRPANWEVGRLAMKAAEAAGLPLEPQLWGAM